MSDNKKGIDPTVKRETLYITAWTLTLSVLMQSVFLIAGLWKADVLFGNLLTGACAVGNFLLMGITVQKAVDRDEKDAAALMRFSQSVRLFMQLAVCAAGVLFFDPISAILPLFFPRIAVTFRPLFGIKNGAAASQDVSDDNVGQGDE
ncbi:MAG: hypothetical protein IIZ59_02010 [Clostridia bacterium]|nr:hypothetical protein [Clostridia bacterium]